METTDLLVDGDSHLEDDPNGLVYVLLIVESPPRTLAKKKSLSTQTQIQQKAHISEPIHKRKLVSTPVEEPGVKTQRRRASQHQKVTNNDVKGEKRDPEQYKCKICSKQLWWKSKLEAHMAVTHNGRTPYQCKICGKHIRNQSSLDEHMASHTGERPFLCSICGVRIRHSLKRHMQNVHTPMSERRFRCSVCPAAFGRKWGLIKHERSHDKVKPYKCKTCDKSFREKAFLKRHENTHTGTSKFKCEYCKKTFTQSYSINIHLRTHTGEKPFKCDVCDKKFHRKDLLSLHKSAIHEKQLLHKCGLCKKAYSTRCALTTHMRSKHKSK